MKKIVFLLLHFISFLSFAQVIDDFSDGDFTNNPTWSGDISEFIVNSSFQLQSNGPAASSVLHLSTPSTFALNCEWRFWVRCNFSPSTTNLARIYLISDQANLEGNLNGYYIQIGGISGNSDAIDLFRQDGSTRTKIISGIPGNAGANDNIIGIKVVRNSSGFWEVYSDITGGTNYQIEGSTADNTYTTSAYMGVVCVHTATRNTHFYYDDFYAGPIIIDTTPPSVNSVNVVDANTLQVVFSEGVTSATAQNLANYNVNNGIGAPNTADLINAYTVELTFSTAFTDGLQNTLTVQNISDFSNNIMGSQNVNFTYFAPAVAVEYDVVFNELMADPDPQVSLPNQEFIEIYNRSNKNLNLFNWTLSDQTSTVTLPSYNLAPGSYLILCSNANVPLFSGYGPTLGLSSLPSLNNTSDVFTLKNQNGNLIDVVAYSDSWYKDPIKKNGGWTLERISYQNFCRDSANWSASMHPNGGTPGAPNSVFNQFTDILPPQIQSYTLQNPNTVILNFNESIDSVNALNLTNYVINNGIGIPQSVSIMNKRLTIGLTFANALQPNTVYELTVNNLQDCIGNVNNSFTITLGIPESANLNDIIINELMADPDPVVGLPNAEFVELFNASNKIIDLSGFKFTDGTTTVTLNSFLILPNQFLILTSTSSVGAFSAYGNVMGVGTLPSLNNSGDDLALLDPNGNPISQVSYKDSWYKDPMKKNGGWTLERVSPFNACNDSANWRASNHPSGGTPGAQNSVFNQFTDVQAPQPLSISVQNPYTVILKINESVNIADASNPNKYVINNGIGVAQSVNITNNGTTIELTFSNALQPSIIYELTVNNLRDCIGNINNFFTIALGIPEPAVPYDVVINELMADPEPVVNLPNQEFVELLNRSNKIIDLGGWSFTDGSTTVTLPSTLLLPNQFLLLTSTVHVPLFTPYGKVLGVGSLPSLNNSGDDLALYDANDNLISQVKYRDSWYKDAVKKNGGWSLERIDPNIFCDDSANWRASNDINGGTPNQINSIHGQIQDVQAPNIDNAFIELPSTIYVTFNETFDPSVWDLTNFNLQGFGNPISYSSIENPILKLTFSTTFSNGTIYNLDISQVKDCIGNLSNNLTVQVGVPTPAVANDVIINEIMADPDPVVGLPEVEYIEIYNRSNKIIDVSDWTLSDNLSNGKFPKKSMILPNSYWILCSSSAYNELKNLGKTLILSSFPGLNNSGELLTLRDKDGNLIDFVHYSDTWYKDENKKKGGWSLERIDPNACILEENWKASIDSTGGTPGKINSVYGQIIDNIPPKIHKILFINKTTIRVVFNEKIDDLDIENVSIYDLQPIIGQPISVIANFEKNQVELIFPFELDSNKVYTLIISNIKDCSGNLANLLTGEVVVPITAKPGDIIINEILYEPRTGGKRFVEIYNKTNQWIDISKWKIGRANEEDVVYQSVEIPNFSVIKPFGYVAFTQDTMNVKSEYNPPPYAVFIQLNKSIPSFDNDSDKVVLMNSAEIRMDEVKYNKNWHYNDLVTRKGVSLERLSPEKPSQNESNWFSASSVVNFGTPGYKNSQSYRPEIKDKTFYVDPKVFSPDFDGFEDVLALHYAFSNNDNNLRITIFDSEGRIVKILKNNILVGNEPGYFLWDGTDDSGRTVQIGTYIAVLEVVNISTGEKNTYKAAFVVAKKP